MKFFTISMLLFLMFIENGCDPYFVAKMEIAPECTIPNADVSNIIKNSIHTVIPNATIAESKECPQYLEINVNGDILAGISTVEDEGKYTITIDALTDTPQLLQIRHEIEKRLIRGNGIKKWEINRTWGMFCQDDI